MNPGDSPLEVARTRAELSSALEGIRSRGRTLALVPTMGALHEGHLSLLALAREEADAVAVSIFVNPLQFGEGEDLESYPRDLESDLKRLAPRGADLVFAPSDGVVYPRGEPVVQVDPGRMGTGLCGRYRPGHFRGVLTVVAKLFGLLRPDVAVFGRKDFQQSVLIRRMASDLEFRVRVVAAPIVREADGLAMSSRNVHLSDRERPGAVGLYRALTGARARFRAGERRGRPLLDAAREILSEHPSLTLQYLELVDPETLAPADPVGAETVAAGAVFSGRTRLIDNLALGTLEVNE